MSMYSDMLDAAERLASGKADNLDQWMLPQNPTGCFLDAETQSLFYATIGMPPSSFSSLEHRVMAVCLAAEILQDKF